MTIDTSESNSQRISVVHIDEWFEDLNNHGKSIILPKEDKQRAENKQELFC